MRFHLFLKSVRKRKRKKDVYVLPLYWMTIKGKSKITNKVKLIPKQRMSNSHTKTHCKVRFSKKFEV